MLGSYVKRLAIGSSAKAIQSVIQVRKLGINRIDKFIKESIATPGVPFVENYRSAWPDISDNTTDETLAHLNSRTIPDSALKFEMKTTFVRGSRIFYSHLNYHPADFKVIMRANINDLGLNEGEKKVLIRMLGPRYNPGNQELKLTTEKYSHRLENKKHLTYLIEQLVQASKELYPQAAQYPMDSE